MSATLVRYRNLCMVRVPSKVHMPDNPDGMCGYQIDNAPLDIPIIGEAPSERSTKLIYAMGKHLKLAHPEIWTQLEAASEKVMKAFLVARAFRIEDPNALNHLRLLRAEILQLIGRLTVQDHRIRDMVNSWGLEGDTAERAFQMIAEMRDVLIEARPPQP